MTHFDSESERFYMVEHHLRRRGIHDEEVLAVMGEVPRELFVPPEMVEHAYEDRALSIGEGQTISQPWIVAYMTQALRLRPRDTVLEIGTGSGYQAAVLASLASHVYTVERIASLAGQTEKLFARLGYQNITVVVGDGTLGFPSRAPYDAIIVTAASPGIPAPLLEQLKTGGRLIIPREADYSEVLVLVRRHEKGYSEESLVECRFVPLIGEHGYRR
jgi:protein-L-isoaspartate(D-aspartate) O-methyltransferase